jgi:catechol 2,3-dioxygenase-like lactoylglutathione lyase family enzyme
MVGPVASSAQSVIRLPRCVACRAIDRGVILPIQRGQMLKKLDIVSMRVRDWAAALAWYRDKLGLEPAALHGDPWCLLTFPEGDATLALDGTNPVGSGNNCIPSIQVHDLPNTVLTLKERGVHFVREPEGDEGYRMAAIADPEGNVINLYEYLKG